MNRALLEGLKEVARVSLMASIPILIDGLSKNVVDWRLIGISAIIAGLRFIDKILHEYGKDTKNDLLTKGLTRF